METRNDTRIIDHLGERDDAVINASSSGWWVVRTERVVSRQGIPYWRTTLERRPVEPAPKSPHYWRPKPHWAAESARRVEAELERLQSAGGYPGDFRGG
jgi:hypothetical protein